MRLFWLGMAWLAGIGLGRVAELPAWMWIPVLAIGGLATVASPKRWRLWSVGWILLAAGGLRYASARPNFESGHLVGHNDRGQVIRLTGVVTNFPDVRDSYVGLRVRAELIAYPGEAQPTQVEGDALVRASRLGDYRYGDRVEVRGLLETPPAWGDSSYRDYLSRQGIYSWVSPAEVVSLASDQANPLLAGIFRLRQRALDEIGVLYPDPEGSLLAGILLGLESGIDPQLRQAFNDTSTTHIIAISGFNITVLAALVIRLFGGWLGPRRGAAAAAATIAVYTVLVGADPAVVRAAIMGGLALLARLLGRQTHAMASLSAAAIAMTSADPLILWDVGFQLSFAATLGLVLYSEPLTAGFIQLSSRWLPRTQARRLARPVGEFGLFTLAAQATTLPLTAIYFGRLSLVALIANPVILPAQPPLMVLGGMATLCAMLWRPVGQLLAWISWPFPAFTVRAVRFFAGWPSASVSLGEVSVASIVAVYLLLFSLTALLSVPPDRRPFRSLAARLPKPPALAALAGLLLLTGLTWLQVNHRPDGRIHLYVLDVGRGEAVLIRSPTGRYVLVNGGGSPVALSSALGRRLPLFHRKVDWVVLAGTEDRQVAGLLGLVGRYPVAGVLTSGTSQRAVHRRVLDELSAAQSAVRLLAPGQVLELGGGAELEAVEIGRRGAVLLLQHGNARILLASGADPELITKLLRDPRLVDLTALLLADGGNPSRNPTHWLVRVRPTVALISVDAGDRRSPPFPSSIEGLEGSTVLRTDVNGWIELITDGAQLWAQVERAPPAAQAP